MEHSWLHDPSAWNPRHLQCLLSSFFSRLSEWHARLDLFGSRGIGNNGHLESWAEGHRWVLGGFRSSVYKNVSWYSNEWPQKGDKPVSFLRGVHMGARLSFLNRWNLWPQGTELTRPHRSGVGEQSKMWSWLPLFFGVEGGGSYNHSYCMKTLKIEIFSRPSRESQQ